jgi:hypothetical protein
MEPLTSLAETEALESRRRPPSSARFEPASSNILRIFKDD